MNQRQKEMQHVIYQIDYQKALKAQVQTVLDQLHNNNFETVSEYLTKSYEDGFIGTMMEPVEFPEPKSNEEIAALKAAKADWLGL